MGIPVPRERHDCPGPGCPEKVPYHLLACGPHWWALPRELRRKVSDTWRAGGCRVTEQYLEARQEAVDYMQAAKQTR